MANPVENLLGCNQCGAPLKDTGGSYSCTACGRAWEREGRIVFNRPRGEEAIFDALFEQMQIGNQEDEVWRFCYEQQAKLALNLLGSGSVALDVGCGPALAYRRPEGVTIVGVDPSLGSLRANSALDLAIWGSAASLPLRPGVIDFAFCFYSVHHMVGKSQVQNRSIVSSVFRELGRVVKRGGSIVVFDMSPWYLAWLAERLSWNYARVLLGEKLDMYFWRESALIRVAGGAVGEAKVRTQSFMGRPFSTFPPIFRLPWLRIPRFLYPMNPTAYIWTLA